MKTILSFIGLVILGYAFAVIILLFGVAIGFIDSNDQSLLSKSVRFIFIAKNKTEVQKIDTLPQKIEEVK